MRWPPRARLVAYIGYRLHRAVAACRLLSADDVLYWLQQSRQQADHADGRRHHAGRRSLRQGRNARRSFRRGRSKPTRTASAACSPRFLRFGDGQDDAIMPDNAEWLTKLNWIEMLRDIGRHFSVNRMLAMDSVKLRLERDQEMSFIEFNYMILPSLRFRRTGAAATAAGCRWAARTNGAISSTASISAAAWARRNCTR